MKWRIIFSSKYQSRCQNKREFYAFSQEKLYKTMNRFYHTNNMQKNCFPITSAGTLWICIHHIKLMIVRVCENRKQKIGRELKRGVESFWMKNHFQHWFMFHTIEVTKICGLDCQWSWSPLSIIPHFIVKKSYHVIFFLIFHLPISYYQTSAFQDNFS